MTCLPIIIIPPITAMSSLSGQYILIFHCTWPLVSGHPMMIYSFSHCKCSSCAVACCIFRIDLHSGMFAVVCIASIFMSMPCISASLFSVWLCLDSQSVMKSSGPGLYITLTWNWCILRGMHCILYDRVATSFWILLLGVYDWLLYLPPYQSNNGEIFQHHAIYPMPLFWCYCTFILHWSDFCLQMQLAPEWFCLVLNPLGMSFHF